MNEPKKDRRVRKTQRALRDGLSSLMTEKNIRDITVQELTDLADLNRATFYLHYRDIYDLQQQIEGDVVDELNTLLNQHLPDVNRGPYALLLEILLYIQANPSLGNMLLGENSNHSFLDKLCAIIEERCLNLWLDQNRFGTEKEVLSYSSSYVIYGYVAVISKWVRTGLNEPPEKLAQMMEDMGTRGMGSFEKV